MSSGKNSRSLCIAQRTAKSQAIQFVLISPTLTAGPLSGMMFPQDAVPSFTSSLLAAVFGFCVDVNVWREWQAVTRSYNT